MPKYREAEEGYKVDKNDLEGVRKICEIANDIGVVFKGKKEDFVSNLIYLEERDNKEAGVHVKGNKKRGTTSCP